MRRRWLSAGIKVAVAAGLAAAVYTYYAHYVSVRQRVAVLLDGPGGGGGGARAEMVKDTPASLKRAEKQLEEVLRLHPRNAFGIVALADVQTQLAIAGYSDRAERAEEARRKADAKRVSFVELFDAHALALLQSGKAAECEAYVRSLLEKYPASPGVPRFYDLLGRAQRAQGKIVEARASFKRAQDADWRAPRFIADYAEALLEEGNAGDALPAFDRALQANPEHVRSQIGKARAQVALAREGRGDARRARSLLDGVLARPEEELTAELRARALAARAEARLALQDTAGAAEDSAAALALAPRLLAPHRARALVDAAARRPSAARELQAAIAADPADASTYFDGAAALQTAGDLAGAEKVLAAYAAALPPIARYHVAQARVLSRKADPKGALAELGKALLLEPANALLYYEQGRLLQQQKDVKGAARAYEQAIQLRDDLPEAYRQVGTVYVATRQVDDAVRAFNNALARYRAARAPPQQLEAFYADVQASLGRAGQSKLAAEWLKQARASQ